MRLSLPKISEKMILEHKGIPIFYDDTGKGPAVVLLHGFLENSTMWSTIIPTLSKTNRVVTIDLLGHGKTACLGYVHSMELMAEAVNAVLKSLRLRRVNLIGHSMGGYVALAFAEKNPQKIKQLCLLNSTAQEDSKERKELRSRANKMVQNNFTGMVKVSVTNLFRPENLDRYKREVEEVKTEALKTPIQGYLACQEGMRIRPNREAVVKTDAFKTFYIIGKDDPILEVDTLVKEAKKNRADFLILEGGHMSHIENKEDVIVALRKFVKG